MGIQMQIRDILTTHPFQMSMTQVKGIVGGNTNAFREAWYELVESGEIVSRGDGPHKTWGLS